MTEFEIDFFTFLALTDSRPEENGLYIVDLAGVRAKNSPADLHRFAIESGKAAHSDLYRFTELAALCFPTTSSRLLEWLESNSDFAAPQWFVEACTSENPTAVLDNAAEELRPLAADDPTTVMPELITRLKQQLPTKPRKLSAKERGAMGGKKANIRYEEARKALIADYLANYSDTPKNRVKVLLHEKYGFSESTARDHLKGIEPGAKFS